MLQKVAVPILKSSPDICPTLRSTSPCSSNIIHSGALQSLVTCSTTIFRHSTSMS